jgi:glycine cleavage system aminomethyltransferase T
VSSLDFLSVDASADHGSFHPVAVSAIDRAQRDLGASFVERGGWRVAVSIPGEENHGAVGIADVSHLTKLEVRPAGEPISVGAGDPGIRLKPDTSCWYEISPRRGLVLCAPALDVSGAYSVIAIAGPEAETVLRRLTHLHHFPSGGEIAHVQGHVLERDGGYWVLCAQELGHYVWDVAVDRASALGGGPIGVDAL